MLVRVPVARVINPVTKTNWQRVGVTPDVKVPAIDALQTAEQLIREGRPISASIAPRDLSNYDARNVHRAGEPVEKLPPMHGIRFSIDTSAKYTSWRGVLSRVAGAVEFANGRGRLDVTATSHTANVSLGDVIIGEPLARPGDYYLFDNTGYILVRPATRTFLAFVFTRADFNHTGALLPGAFLMYPTPNRIDTLFAGNRGERRQHAPVSIHWHMQPRGVGGFDHMYARGWLELADAPAIEAGVARWFEVAAALATTPGGVNALSPDGVEITSVALLRQPGMTKSSVPYLEMLAPLHVVAVDVAPTRLVLPTTYKEQATGLKKRSLSADLRWQSFEGAQQRAQRASCRQAWM